MLKDYRRQRREGLDHVFGPYAVGISGADAWRSGVPTTNVRVALERNAERRRTRMVRGSGGWRK